MQQERIQEKLKILADAAKYDVSCASSGGKRANTPGGIGNSHGMGICHSYTEDGRCVSLLKILLTNYCIFDCAYCVSRRSNDVQRAAFTVQEVVELTMNFYKRNYIEGLFLSSGIFKNADYTTERLVRVAKELRTVHHFNGYIHLKVIPGASDELMREAGLFADRLSVNIEIPSEEELKKVAPEKNYADVLAPMELLKDEIVANREERKLFKHAPTFAAGGQSTQMVVGATPETDLQVLGLADSLYREKGLKRVYYSGYVPISADERMPVLSHPPLLRENRLYQADWLMRFYGYKVGELVDATHPTLDTEVDPKLAYALRHPAMFPIDVNKADYAMILRIPGVGIKSANKIIAARRFGRLRYEHLQGFGVVMKRAKYFLTCADRIPVHAGLDPNLVRKQLLHDKPVQQQLSLF